MNDAVRPFEEVDYGAVSDLHTARFKDIPLSAGEIRFVDETRDPRCILRRWIVTSGRNAAGFAELTQSSETYHPTRFNFRICVSPEFEGRGFEESLFDEITSAFRAHQGRSLSTTLREGQEDLTTLLGKRGFKPSMFFWEKCLALDTPSAAFSLPDTRLPQEIRVATLAELQSDAVSHRKLFDLEKQLRQDTPRPEDTTMRFDYFQRATLGNPSTLRDGYFVAVDRDRYVGRFVAKGPWMALGGSGAVIDAVELRTA